MSSIERLIGYWCGNRRHAAGGVALGSPVTWYDDGWAYCAGGEGSEHHDWRRLPSGLTVPEARSRALAEAKTAGP